MAFTKKHIDVSFSLASGQFQGGGNSLTIKDHRVNALINVPGGADKGLLECAIYGLSLSEMNQLTTLGTQTELYSKNNITLKAYAEGEPGAVVYKGTIHTAFADMRAMPQTCLRVSALAGLFAAVKPVEPTTYQGSADVKTLMEQIAKKAEFDFEDNGVTAKIMNPYLPGSAWQQAAMLAQAAGIPWIMDKGKLAIWPSGQTRKGGTPLIAPPPRGNMVGYPAYRQGGIEVTTLFDPNIQFGGGVQVESDLKPACGKWTVVNLDYVLDSETPKGRWFAILTLGPIAGGAPA